MHPNSLANLAPAFTKGNNHQRTNHAVKKALWKCRKLSVEMVDIAAKIARDEREETKDRLRAVEIILARAIPSVHGGNGVSPIRLDANASCLRIEIVDPHTDQIVDVTPAKPE